MQNSTHRAQIKKRRNRLMLALVGCIVLVVFVSLIVMMTSPTVYERRPIPTEESLPDGFQLTSTAVIEQVTETAVAREQALAATPSPDAFDLTATELIGQFTETALAEVNATAGVATLQPTPTLLPFTHLEDKWLQQLEDRFGFSHPVFEHIVQFHLDYYGDNLESANHANVYSDVYFYTSQDKEYVAVQSAKSDFSNYHLLIFKVDGDVELLLSRPIAGIVYPLGFDSAFADFNQNGFINFAYSVYDNCPSSNLVILEFEDDKISDISPITEECDEIIRGYVLFDLDDNGLLDFVGMSDWDRYYRHDLQVLDEDVIYKWNGERYAKVDE